MVWKIRGGGDFIVVNQGDEFLKSQPFIKMFDDSTVYETKTIPEYYYIGTGTPVKLGQLRFIDTTDTTKYYTKDKIITNELYSPKQLIESVNKTVKGICYKENNMIVAFIIYKLNEDTNNIYISMVQVHPEHRGKKYCNLIISELINKYLDNNYTFTLLDSGDKFPIKNNETQNTISYSCLCYIKTFAEHGYDAFISNNNFEKIGVEPVTIENCKTSKRKHYYLIFIKKN